MMKSPTYTAEEIKEMVCTFSVDYDAFKIIADIIDDEIDLYNDEDLLILMNASLIMFTRSLLKLSLKNIR